MDGEKGKLVQNILKNIQSEQDSGKWIYFQIGLFGRRSEICFTEKNLLETLWPDDY